ncbi:anaphase-promoting complex, cyclosome, subunit 4-domain-containing protein [Copromyces sp. CBS 386.78]|nr:anaphase-promoting complex, cyclosome, subunit 4-domain-containing protein [Copromyces sp. CBS 386.78]
MSLNRQLQLFSSSTLSVPVSGKLIACNPVIDLTATVGDVNVIYVWRGSNQLVSKHTERNQKVDAIKWKEDGQFLAAGWSDGVVRLIGLESNKAVHHIRVAASRDGQPSKIEFIAWARNEIDRQSHTGRKHDGLPDLPWRELVPDEKKHVLDLPHELTFLEVETALPKISPLPLSGGTGDDMFVFSTAASLEFVFRPYQPEDSDNVHVMIAGTADGGIHLSIYDSFVIGTFQHAPHTARGSPSGKGAFQLCGHSSHPKVSTHALLLRPKEGSLTSLYVVPMDLTFIHKSPINLSLLASKTTTLQNLLRYLKQAQSHMISEWKSTRELPGRFLRGVQEDLEKSPKGPVTIVQALYHTVATGHVFPQVKEWLVDSLAERGHKRWDKAVVSGLQNLRSLVHENFLPALERCGIVLSRLLGLARFHGSSDNIGFTASQIEKLLDMIAALTLVSYKILLGVMDELDHFTCFSSWLRMEIDKLASSSAAAEELTEKEATMDNVKVLTYIQRYLMGSPLGVYLGDIAAEEREKDWKVAEENSGISMLELVDQQLKNQEHGKPYLKALPKIDQLVNHLTGKSAIVFKEIAEAEKRSVRFNQAVEISTREKIWRHDVHLCSRSKATESGITTFVTTVPEDDKNKIFFIRTVIPVANGISGTPSSSACGLALPNGATVVDIKFLDDESLLVLSHLKDEQSPALVRIGYQSPTLPYSVYKEGERPHTIDIGGPEMPYVPLFFNAVGFVPIQMEIQRASKTRGELPARVCLLGRDRTVYKTYALPDHFETSSGALARSWTERKSWKQQGEVEEDVVMENSQ